MPSMVTLIDHVNVSDLCAFCTQCTWSRKTECFESSLCFQQKKKPTHERPCICNSIGHTTRCCRFDYWLMIWNLTVPITKTRKLFRSAGTKPQKVNNLTIIQFNFRVHDSSLSVLKMALTCCNSNPLLFFVIKECRGIVQ